MITLHLTKHQTDVLNFSFDRGQSATHTQKNSEMLWILASSNARKFHYIFSTETLRTSIVLTKAFLLYEKASNNAFLFWWDFWKEKTVTKKLHLNCLSFIKSFLTVLLTVEKMVIRDMQSNVELLTIESTICHPLDRRATLDLENYVAIIS